MVDCRTQKNLDVALFTKDLPLFDFIERYSSIPAPHKGKVWTSILRNESDMEKLPIYGKSGGTSGIRLILKNELLKRWDYHINEGWHSTFPLNFDRDENGKSVSYGPAEMEEFMKQGNFEC